MDTFWYILLAFVLLDRCASFWFTDRRRLGFISMNPFSSSSSESQKLQDSPDQKVTGGFGEGDALGVGATLYELDNDAIGDAFDFADRVNADNSDNLQNSLDFANDVNADASENLDSTLEFAEIANDSSLNLAGDALQEGLDYGRDTMAEASDLQKHAVDWSMWNADQEGQRAQDIIESLSLDMRHQQGDNLDFALETQEGLADAYTGGLDFARDSQGIVRDVVNDYGMNLDAMLEFAGSQTDASTGLATDLVDKIADSRSSENNKTNQAMLKAVGIGAVAVVAVAIFMRK